MNAKPKSLHFRWQAPNRWTNMLNTKWSFRNGLVTNCCYYRYMRISMNVPINFVLILLSMNVQNEFACRNQQMIWLPNKMNGFRMEKMNRKLFELKFRRFICPFFSHIRVRWLLVTQCYSIEREFKRPKKKNPSTKGKESRASYWATAIQNLGIEEFYLSIFCAMDTHWLHQNQQIMSLFFLYFLHSIHSI